VDTANDTEDPTISCPAPIEVDAASPSGTVVVYAPVSGSDNGPGESISQTAGLDSGSEFPVGITTESFEITDAARNTATCSFTVTGVIPYYDTNLTK
jgi:hypothetical protein